MSTSLERITKLNSRLEDLIDRGFDDSYIKIDLWGSSILVHCSQCQALVINGVACHETGCPNQNHHVYDDIPEGG